jgi:hypothetical protein
MRHDTLKTEIKTAQTTTHNQRAEASSLIRRGRDLRKQCRAESNQDTKLSLYDEGEKCRVTGMALRADANYDRDSRRHMHLAAGLLNGKTYLQCESKCESLPYAKAIASWVKPCLPEGVDATALVQEWITKGEVKAKSLLPVVVEAAA